MGKKYTLLLNGKETGMDEVKKRFDTYNQMYFNGELGKCCFYWLVNGDTQGKYNLDEHRKNKPQSRIGISRNVRWTDETLRDVLVHEMIHMYVTTVEGKNIDGLLGHGRRFRKHMNYLNKHYGLNIKIHERFDLIHKVPEPSIFLRFLEWLIDR